MCFSAKFSFGASLLLSVIGALSLYKTKEKSHKMFASTPLLFAIQQFFEGVLWIIIPLANYDLFHSIVTYIYLFFALLLWPIWSSASLIRIELSDFRRKILNVFLSFGIIWSLVVASILGYYGANSEIISCHISYYIKSLKLPYYFYNFGSLYYLVVTVWPFFISGYQIINYLGFLLLASYLISYLMWSQFLISVWCFFAAILSVFIFFIVQKVK